jgi:hypothetical protein
VEYGTSGRQRSGRVSAIEGPPASDSAREQGDEIVPVVSRAISKAKAVPSSESAGSQRPRLVTELSDIQHLFDAVVADSQSASARVDSETAQPVASAPTVQGSGSPHAPTEATAHGQVVRTERVERSRQVEHDVVPVDFSASVSVPAASAAVLRILDAAQEEVLLDRLVDRLEERLRDQAIRQLGFTGGLT